MSIASKEIKNLSGITDSFLAIMTAGLEQLDRLINAPIDLAFAQTIRAHEDELVDLNKKQLDRGLDAAGHDLGQYSSIKYKGRLKPVDLLLTGAFRGSFVIDPVSGGFVSSASDEKTPFLEKRYGPDIVGTPEQDLIIVADLLAETFVNTLENQR